MLDAWLNRSRVAGPAEKLLALPEQEFAAWAPGIAVGRPGVVVSVFGDSGSGKSSLVRQTLRNRANVQPRRIACLPAAQWPQFADEFPDAENLLSVKHRPATVVIEELHLMPEPQIESERLAAWIDRWRPAGISLAVTSDRLPCEIPQLSQRLRNRLHGGLFAAIRPLSHDSMHRLWRKWSAEFFLPAWQPDRLPPNIQTAGQLKTWALEFSQDSAGSGSATNRVLSLDAIAQAVAHEFGVSLPALQSGGRALQLRIPRCVAMWLARELTPLSLSTISRYFGCRSHTTVARSGSRLEQLTSVSPSLRQQLQSLRTTLRQELLEECG